MAQDMEVIGYCVNSAELLLKVIHARDEQIFNYHVSSFLILTRTCHLMKFKGVAGSTWRHVVFSRSNSHSKIQPGALL